MIKYRWEITAKANQYLIELEAVKLLINNIPTLPHLELNLRRQSLLKSAVFSARVEGYQDTTYSPKKESQNLLFAYNFIYSKKAPKNLSLGLIRKFHRLALKNKSSGNWRTEPWAIFNSAGIAIYLAPPTQEISVLMDEYVEYLASSNDHPAVVAAVAQFIFEKIHPFADGNGRVGRLISSFMLERGGFGFRGLAPFEEYIEEHRSLYYSNLEPSNDCTGFIEFLLEALVSQLKKDIGRLGENRQELPEDSLLPRRREILEIVRDHPFCTFDFIRRRFTAVNIKTLHYDISQLQKNGLIRKRGKTRGVSYQAV